MAGWGDDGMDIYIHAIDDNMSTPEAQIRKKKIIFLSPRGRAKGRLLYVTNKSHVTTFNLPDTHCRVSGQSELASQASKGSKTGSVRQFPSRGNPAAYRTPPFAPGWLAACKHVRRPQSPLLCRPIPTNAHGNHAQLHGFKTIQSLSKILVE